MLKALTIVFALLFLITACQGENAKTEEKAEVEMVGYTLLVQGIQSGISEAQDLIIDNKAAMDSIWAAHYSYLDFSPEPPEINFDKDIVVGVFLGEKPTTGYWVKLDSIFIENGEQIVLVSTNDKPSDDVDIVQMATQPFFMAATTKTKHNLKFEFVVEEQ